MYSKITVKYQMTIPRMIREHLGLIQGDLIDFQITNEGLVLVQKVQTSDIGYINGLDSTLDEWNSKEDDEAFEHLQSL